uniref:ABC transporter domain-containing protein n=1 Tax=Arcella intermedia TaxID=1963864 RepID=A0A6B2LL92_9EUKA
MFIGTLRSNLDPFNEHPDEELWEVLKKVHLFKFVKSLPMGLEAEIQEKGNNLSLGQRQLICIARALLRKSQILILDEATASVDYETDHLIQQTIKESFSHCTILTIAHRLHTIVHSDRILVLEGGNVLEFDTPAKLLSDSDSQFSSLVKETDPQTQAFLQNAILNST